MRQHIKEIQAFQHYFEMVYDPLHLSRTLHHAAQTLPKKLLEIFTKSNFLLLLKTNIFLLYILKISAIAFQ